MPRMMVIRVGYEDYACTPLQAITLVQVFESLRPVKHKGNYTGPYVFDYSKTGSKSNEINNMSMEDVEEPEPPAEHLAITHDPVPAPPAEPLAIAHDPAPEPPVENPKDDGDIPF
jgi:hypothetical protein